MSSSFVVDYLEFGKTKEAPTIKEPPASRPSSPRAYYSSDVGGLTTPNASGNRRQEGVLASPTTVPTTDDQSGESRSLENPCLTNLATGS